VHDNFDETDEKSEYGIAATSGIQRSSERQRAGFDYPV